MKVIIGNGKVANIIKNNDDIIISHSLIEISDQKSTVSALEKVPYGSVVINTAAKINLEWCEANKKEADSVNVDGAINVMLACQKFNHHLVHIGSGCIFDGMEKEMVYTEDDEPSPASYYADTKSRADKALMASGYHKITIVRPRQLISPVVNKTNMITKFLSLGGGDFIDSKNSLTCIEDMKEMIDHLIAGKHYGIFNLANEGYVSPYFIACRIKDKVDKFFNPVKISYQDYLNKILVKRVNALLSVDKLKSSGYQPRTAIEALDWCLDNYGK
jgi:dTDP-4-dehydrorhamnose reductase